MAINGTDLRVWISNSIVANATSHSLSLQMGTRKTSNKDSGIYETKEPARLEITGTSDSLMVHGNYEAIFAAVIARTPVKMDFGQKNSGNANLDTSKFYASGYFILTDININAPDNDNATYSISFEHSYGFHIITGTLTRNTDIVAWSGYFALATNFALSYDGTPGRSLMGNSNLHRIRQNGNLVRIQTYFTLTADVSQSFLDVWRFDGSYFDRIHHVDISALDADGLNTITLPSPIAVQRGDYVSLSGMLSNINSVVLSDSTVVGDVYYTAGYPSASNFDWLSESHLDNHGCTVKGFGQAPMVVILGDSIISGASPSTSLIEAATTFTLANSLCYQLEQQNALLVSQNMGLGGTSTTQIAARITADCINLKPKIAILQGGVNDIAGGVISKATYLENYRNMIEACQAAQIVPVVCKILPWTNGTTGQMQTRDDWSEDLETLVGTYAGAIFVDFDEGMGLFRSGGDPGNLWDLQVAYDSDGIHITTAGVIQMANIIEAAIVAVYTLA